MSRDDNLCWFHGKLSRESAEELIQGKENGTYLVRESNTAVGDFVLTLIHQGEVCHYQIRRHGEDAFFSIDDKVKILHGLDTLVEFYQQAAHGLVSKLTTHVRKDPPPNDSRSHGVTNLLHRATKENNHTVVSELLKCGYRNVDAKNQDGQTAMHLAAQHCDETILQLLLTANVNVNCMDTLGNMPLHYACRRNSASFVRTLIVGHANVQGRNIKNGYVPLHEAAIHGNLEVVQELLAAHAPLLPRTSSGEFPIDLAREAGHEAVVAFLNGYKLPPASTYKWEWYHGTLNRDEAIEQLMTFATKKANCKTEPESSDTEVPSGAHRDDVVAVESQDRTSSTVAEFDSSGCFLVRFSERKSGGSGYVLTLLWNNNVKNFIISQSSSYLYIDDGPYLPSLEHLVEHFTRFSDGLPVRLKCPVLPKPKPPLPQFSTMPRITQKKSSDTILPNTATSHSVSVTPMDEKFQKNSLDGQKTHAITSHSQTLTSSNKKKLKTHSSSVFNTLRLRKSKTKAKATGSVADSNETFKNVDDDLKKTESVLKNLSFSTEFSAMQPEAGVEATQKTSAVRSVAVEWDGFYNVPKNNAAIATSPINSPIQSPVHNTFAMPPHIDDAVDIESKTDAEVEYFTKSDMIIERERTALPLAEQQQQPLEARPSKFATNSNGYIPTVDIRVFLDQGSMSLGTARDTLEASAAELRAFSKNPERLDSLISNVSNESDIMRYLERQNSNNSTATQYSEAGTQIKLNYFIPREFLELEAIIGGGEFGSVYKGSLIRASSSITGDKEVCCAVAVKTLLDEHCRKNKQEFLREASVMIRLHHHCIVQLIGISKGETLMMVQELVALGSMLDFIHKEKVNPNYELKLWASQIACGMQYLESNHFVHRDLAARNILLASRNQAKISDFGLSRALGSGNDCYQATQGGKWPIKWYAPESFNNGLFSHASDVWSFGVTLWEMFSLGEPPYGDIPGVEAIALIERGQRLPQPTLCQDHVYEIMRNCWNYKPKDRPTFRYLTDFFARDPDYENIMELIKSEHIN